MAQAGWSWGTTRGEQLSKRGTRLYQERFTNGDSLVQTATCARMTVGFTPQPDGVSKTPWRENVVVDTGAGASLISGLLVKRLGIQVQPTSIPNPN